MTLSVGSFVLNLLLVSLLSGCCVADVTPEVRDALVTLYNSTQGEDWYAKKNWLTGDPCQHHWHGVFCGDTYVDTDRDDFVLAIDLVDNHLQGTIPTEMGDLPDLRSLELDWNSLQGGTLPTEIGNLHSLTLFTCSRGCSFENGTLPTEMGNLRNLSFLSMHFAGLSGQIPTELGNAPMRYLNLEGTGLDGSIPTEFGNFPTDGTFSGTVFYLGFNRLSGTIPTEFKSLKIATLDLGLNSLHGKLGDWICDINKVRLNDNNFDCPLPSCCTTLSSVSCDTCDIVHHPLTLVQALLLLLVVFVFLAVLFSSWLVKLDYCRKQYMVVGVEGEEVENQDESEHVVQLEDEQQNKDVSQLSQEEIKEEGREEEVKEEEKEDLE